MRYGLIERKITVFISSKIDERYNIVRKALKTLLLETGLVASVYAFETEGACSEDVKSAYLKEVSQSDLCVFLIDNADGVPDAVLAEHARAKSEGIHRLYFFCDEREKKPTPLQNELMNTGEVQYCDKVHEFSDFPQIAYNCILQDIIDLYRRNKNILSNKDEGFETNSVFFNTFVLKKDIFKRYTLENKLTQVFNPYVANITNDLEDSVSTYDDLCAVFLSAVIGKSNFNPEKFLLLKENILLTHEDTIKKIIDLRLDAVLDYYSNNLGDCYRKIYLAYKKAKEFQNVPMWLLNDIALDMRNINYIICRLKNKISFNSYAQKILDESPEIIYYPLIDRFDSSNNSRLLKEYFEMHTQSPYSRRFEVMNRNFEDIASIFNIAIRFGSLTHIIITKERYRDILITKYIDSGDFKYFLEIIRILLIIPDDKTLNRIVNTYNKHVSAISSIEIEILINSIKTIPIEYYRIIGLCLLLENFGYYFNDEQYNAQIDFFLQHVKNWCSDKNKTVDIGHYILKAIKANIYRMNNQKIAELLCLFFDNHLVRFYDEVLEILSYIDCKQIDEIVNKKITEYCIAVIKEKSYVDIKALQRAVISIRKNVNNQTELLDRAIRQYIPDFYCKEYDLVTNTDNITKHIKDYIDVIHQRNQEASEAKYSLYYDNPYDIIRWIIETNDVDLNEDNVIKIIAAVEKTLLNKVQQADQKKSAMQLAFYLYCNFPSYSFWYNFKKKIAESSEDILSAMFDPVFGIDSLNSLKFNFLLMKIGFGFCTFEEAALGFAAVMSYNEADFINAVRSIYIFLNDIDISILDDKILSIISNFILSIGIENHKNAQLYAIKCLIKLSNSQFYSTIVLEKLAYIMNDTISDIKLSILNGIRNLEKDNGIRDYILQKGRTDNNYLVRKLAEKITEALLNNVD